MIYMYCYCWKVYRFGGNVMLKLSLLLKKIVKSLIIYCVYFLFSFIVNKGV